MAKSTYAQCNFTWGEISPRAYGRFDMAQFYNAVKTMENFLGYQTGGAQFWPGTVFVSEIKDSTKLANLIPFQYNTEQNYAILVSDYLFRFYANKGIVLDGGTIFELATVFAEADIFDLNYAQDADTMYMVHKSYYSQKLQRLTATTFTIGDVNFVRGPFMDKNITATTITPSGAGVDTGPGITLTASADLFYAGHVKSLWRIKNGVVKITQVNSPTEAVGDVQAEPTGVAGNLGTSGVGQTDWAEGAFSAYRGYPVACGFHEGRLWYAKDQYFYGSVMFAYDDFAIGSNDADAVVFEIASNEANVIRWISTGSKTLQLGTSGGSFSAFGGSGVPITASTINVQKDTNYGVANILPKRISSYLYYVQRNLYQVRELLYNFYIDSQTSSDMNDLADHMLRDGGGAVDMDHQQSPNDRLWCVRKDGQLAVLTRNAEQQVKGWCRRIAGSTAMGPGKFEAICILQQDQDDDEIWVVVNRNINGVNKRYVEYFSSEFFDYSWEPVRLDCSLTYDNPVTITQVLPANPILITAPLHGFAEGDQVRIDNVFGTTELNENIYYISNVGQNTFNLMDDKGNFIDGSAFGAYLSGGQVRKMVQTFSGLDHLEGETVSVLADGGVPSAQQTFVVTNGSITLKHKAAVVHVGLPYKGTLRFLKQSGGAQVGQTKMRRIYLSTIRIFKSLGFKIGQDENNLKQISFATPNKPPLGRAPELVTGDVEEFFEAWWDKEAEVVIIQDQPLPLMILAAVFRSETEEKE